MPETTGWIIALCGLVLTSGVIAPTALSKSDSLFLKTWGGILCILIFLPSIVVLFRLIKNHPEFIKLRHADEITHVLNNITAKKEINVTNNKTYLAGYKPLKVLIIFFITLISIYLLTDLLINAAASGLYDPSVLGVSIPEIDAAHLVNMFIGLIYIGMFFPLSAIAAFFCGWTVTERLHFKLFLTPTVLFTSTAFIYKNAGEILQTGLPPSVNGIRMMFHFSNQNIDLNPADIVVMWLITLCLFSIVTLVFCCFFYICSRFGWSFSQRKNCTTKFIPAGIYPK